MDSIFFNNVKKVVSIMDFSQAMKS